AANLDFLLQCAHGAKPIQPRRLGKVGKACPSQPGEQWGSCVCRLFPTITFNYGSLQCGLCVRVLNPPGYCILSTLSYLITSAGRVRTHSALSPALGLWTRRSSSEQDSCVWDHTSPLQRGLTTAQKQPEDRPSNPPHLPACVPRKPLQGSPGRIQTWASPLPFVPLAFKAGQEPLLLSARSQPRASPCHLALGSARCSECVCAPTVCVCAFALESVPLALCY
ncbi:hypothetical protein KUCAC02_006768, partial [Chaenocephalus aceratus]